MEELIYDSITYLIVLFAAVIAVKKVLQKSIKKDEASCSDGCGGCTSKCDLKELVKKPEINR